ncbi:MAG: hypothetical protein ACPGXL_07525, partial [Chitinophagales bacterium]
NDAQHQANRRTEFFITGIDLSAPKYSKPKYFYDSDYHIRKNYYKNGATSSNDLNGFSTDSGLNDTDNQMNDYSETNTSSSNNNTGTGDNTYQVSEDRVNQPDDRGKFEPVPPPGDARTAKKNANTSGGGNVDFNNDLMLRKLPIPVPSSDIGVQYKVLLEISLEPDLDLYADLEQNKLGELNIEHGGGGKKRLVLGTYGSAEDAEIIMKEVKRLGHTNVSITQYKDGFRIVR